MKKLNNDLPVGIYLPLWSSSNPHFSILRLLPEESRVLNSKEKVPYIVVFEILKSESISSTRDLHQVAQSYASIISEAVNNKNEDEISIIEKQPDVNDFKSFFSLYLII